MEEKKDNKGFVIAIIVLILVVFGLIFYILYDKGIILKSDGNEEIVEKDAKTKENVKALSNEEKELFIEKIEGINTFAEYYPLDDVNKIDNQDLLYKLAFKIGFGKSFSEKSMTEMIKNYFGDAYNIKNEDIICSVDNEPFYIYNSDTNMYRYDVNSTHGHGTSGSVRKIVVKYVDGKKENDKKITINTKLLYATYCGDTCGPNFAYYKSYEDSVKNQNPILGEIDSDTEIELTDDLYKTIEDKLPVTTFTFTKKNSNTYNLESVTIS